MGLRGMPLGFIQLKKELGKEKAKIPRKHIKFPFHDGSIECLRGAKGGVPRLHSTH